MLLATLSTISSTALSERHRSDSSRSATTISLSCVNIQGNLLTEIQADSWKLGITLYRLNKRMVNQFTSSFSM
jgi:hypothetical protein